MQIFIHCKTTLHVLGITAPIIRSIKNCTCSLRPDQTMLEGSSGTSSMTSTGGKQVEFLILLMMGAVIPEICRVVFQWINICILLHLLDIYSHWITMHGTTSLKLYFTSYFYMHFSRVPFWSYKEIFLQITYLLNAHYMNHLVYLHCPITLTLWTVSITNLDI